MEAKGLYVRSTAYNTSFGDVVEKWGSIMSEPVRLRCVGAMEPGHHYRKFSVLASSPASPKSPGRFSATKMTQSDPSAIGFEPMPPKRCDYPDLF